MLIETDTLGNQIHRNHQNQIHNLEGPATISRYRNGKISSESWFKNDLCHREDGAAVTVFGYDSNGRQFIIYEGYYLNGKSMTAQDHRDAWDFSNNNV